MAYCGKGNKALVEALDTYLRLLHPVMPFITERLWAAIPHRPEDPALLIVARWPVAGPREVGVEAQVGGEGAGAGDAAEDGPEQA